MDIIIVVKVIGAILTSTGSLLLAWRIKEITKWVVYSIVAHEESINQIIFLLENKSQTATIISGVTKHLLNVQDKPGTALLIIGFVFLGIGMLLNAASYLF